MMNDAIIYNHFTNEWLKFQDPLEIFQTFSINEVIPILKTINEKTGNNIYAAGD